MSITLQLRFFARIREELGVEQEVLESTAANVAEVIEELKHRGEPWEQVLSAPQLLIAVNQEMTSSSTELASGDEVAFFPPVTGG